MADARSSRDEPDLAALAAAAMRGDRDALGCIYDECSSDILRYFRQRIPSQAEDLTHQLFEKLPQKLARYEESGRFEAWLRGVAYNMFLTAQRSERRRSEDTLKTGLEPMDPTTTTLFGTGKARLRKVVERLSPGLRAVWDLHIQGFSHSEIAAELGISVGAATTRLARARAQLIEWLSEPED